MIELKKDAPDAIKCKVYPMSWTEDTALQVFLKEHFTKGYIHPLKSQYALSFFFITKKDGKLCPVQDYRHINGHTIQNQYPHPLTLNLLTNLHGTYIYTKLDIRWGYNNVCIKEGDEHKAAFKTCCYNESSSLLGLATYWL